MLTRRRFSAAVLALLAGCGRAPQAPPEPVVSFAGDDYLTDARIEAFLRIVPKLPGQKLPPFQPVLEVDLTSDRGPADKVARWQREFRSAYSPDVQAKLWKRDSALRTALSDCGVEPREFAAFLVKLSTAVVRESLGPDIDLKSLGGQADRHIASLSSQFDHLDHDSRFSPSIRNSRAEILSEVLKESVAYREFLRLLEHASPQSVSAVAAHRDALTRLMPPTETVLLFRKKLESRSPVIQASHDSARLE